MTRVGVQMALLLTVLLFGWGVGKAQTSAPEFTLAIDAPTGRTTVSCIRGCTLQAERDKGLPQRARVRVTMTNYSYECNAPDRCRAMVNGWLKPQ